MRRFTSYLLTSAGLALAACSSPQVGNVCPDPANCVNSGIDTPIQTTPNNKLDILFLIDNSPSMSPKQLALAENIPLFIDAIEAIPNIDYHLGIADSDIGSWVAPGTPWGAPLGTCNSYEGDDGMLQAKPCTQRTYTDPNDPALTACNMLCPTGNDAFVPNDGTNFISTTNNVTNVLPAGSNVSTAQAVKNAFECMAIVGDQGCGIEGQLEGAKRALDGHNTANAGFLRSDSLLTVIVITDEDDCSVQLSRRSQNNPDTTDCETPDQSANWSCFNPDYRCLATDVQCAQPTNQTGFKTNCTERSDTYLQAVTYYQSFFNGLRPGGNIIVAGIWTTPSLTNGGVFNVIQTDADDTMSSGLNRDTGANAGCTYMGSDPNSQGVFGRPQLRLSAFATAFPGTNEVSVCDTDNYPNALSTIAAKIGSRLNHPCLDGMPKVANGVPECIVGYVDASTPDASPDVAFPVCETSCCNAWAAWNPTLNNGMNMNPQTDPGIMAACGASNKSPCYCAVASTVNPPVCPTTPAPGQAVAGVWEAGKAPPPNSVISFKCAAQ